MTNETARHDPHATPIGQAGVHLHTVRDLMRFAVSLFGEAGVFFGHGHHGAWEEAAFLVAHTLHLPAGSNEPQVLERYLDARLTPIEVANVLKVLRRRVEERLPAAYLTGEAWLGDYRFQVDARVIVPRSFIAELLFEGLEPWIEERGAVGRVLDLCTGSGCLAIIAAQVFSEALVDAVDISPDALAVARANIAAYYLEERVEAIESDLFAALAGRHYDLIITNPPYVNERSMAALPQEYRHEPQLALAGGADGLDLVRQILARAHEFLAPGGLLVVEVGHERPHMEAAFPTLACTWLSTSGGDDMVFLLERDQLPHAD